jgi:voltage-gated potassium channel
VDLEHYRLRGCMHRDATARERLAEWLYDRLHPAMAALGLLFLVLVLSQSAARTGTALHRSLVAATWVLWAVFVAEYGLRLAIAPATGAFLRRTWWQLLFLLVPFLSAVRSVLFLRLARPTRVAIAAVRGSRSARATLTNRAAWLGVVTAIVILGAADVLYRAEAVVPYGRALHAAALAGMTGEPMGSDSGVAQLLDVVLALYAVVFFASLAGIAGAFFVEHRREAAGRGAARAGVVSSMP